MPKWLNIIASMVEQFKNTYYLIAYGLKEMIIVTHVMKTHITTPFN